MATTELSQVNPDPRIRVPPEQSLSTYETARAAREAKIAAYKALGITDPKEMARRSRQENVKKAHEAIKRKKAQRALVQEKLNLGMPITEDEQALLTSRLNIKSKDRQAQEEATIAKASRLLIKPSSVNELRALVDRLASKHQYNPLEELILMTKPKKQADGTYTYQIPAKDRQDIHKSLLPYLTPQLKVAPVREEDPEHAGVKVVITSFTFPEEKGPAKIYDKPTNTSISGVTPAPDSPTLTS